MWGWRSQRQDKSMEECAHGMETPNSSMPQTSLSSKSLPHGTGPAVRTVYTTHTGVPGGYLKRAGFSPDAIGHASRGLWSHLYFLNSCGKVRKRREEALAILELCLVVPPLGNRERTMWGWHKKRESPLEEKGPRASTSRARAWIPLDLITTVGAH